MQTVKFGQLSLLSLFSVVKTYIVVMLTEMLLQNHLFRSFCNIYAQEGKGEIRAIRKNI